MTDEFITHELAKHGITAQRSKQRQLLISKQQGPVWPNRGNSFWITMIGGKWCLATWTPRYYLLPATSDIVKVCVDFMNCSETAAYEMPQELQRKYSAHEIDHETYERLSSKHDD